jgi:ribonuclease VapC
LIVIDSSAVVAIFLDEPEKQVFKSFIEAADNVMSTFNAFETRTVLLGRRGVPAAAAFEQWLENNRVVVTPFDEGQSVLAFQAYARFGKGFHRARLNMGDCAAYALAKSLDAPLLFKGDDFRLTDVSPAL